MNARILLLSILPVFAAMSGLPAEEIFSDDFSGRKTGDLLDASPIQSGNANWTAHPTYVFGEGGGAFLNEDASAALGIPFRFADVSDRGEVVTVTVTADVSSSEWVAINFGSPKLFQDFLSFTKFWVLVRANGKWQVRDGYSFQSESLILAQGEVPLQAGEPVKFSLSYNESAGELVDFSINGESVASGVTFESMRKWPVETLAVFALRGKEGLRIHDFKVSVTKAGEPLPKP